MEKLTIRTKVIDNYIHEYCKIEGDVIIEVQKLPLSRTLKQNKYYWGVVVKNVSECLNEAGYSVNDYDTHEIIKAKFNKKVVENKKGLIDIETVCSTTDLSKEEFTKFIQRIQDWLIDNFNCILPSAEEFNKIYENH